MDEAIVAYLAALAETLYNDALEADRRDDQDMCTANLELTMQVQLELIAL